MKIKAKKKKIDADAAQQLGMIKAKINQDKDSASQEVRDSLIEQEALKHEDSKKEKIKDFLAL